MTTNQQRRIVAFDIGLRNFAFIVADVENKRITNILEWVNIVTSLKQSRGQHGQPFIVALMMFWMHTQKFWKLVTRV